VTGTASNAKIATTAQASPLPATVTTAPIASAMIAMTAQCRWHA
jgi:hypothetical protein